MIFSFNMDFLNKKLFKKNFLLVVFIFITLACNHKLRAENPIQNIPKDLDLNASSLDYDIKNEIFIASGNVTLKINNKVLVADKIIYNAKNFILSAYGNITYIDEQDNIVTAESIVLDKQTDIILIQKADILFKKYAKLKSNEALKNDQNAYFLKDGTFYYLQPTEPYTKPNTLIKFSKANYYHENKIIEFKNAVLYIYGFPLLWTPFISFDDFSLERKAGFLVPSIQYTSYIGTYTILPYYIPLGKSKELFFRLYTPLENITNSILEFQYFGYIPRNQANIKINYLLQDKKANSQWTIFANDTFNVNKYLKITAQIQKTSSLDYLRNYNSNYISTDQSYLNNEINAQIYFNNNNYLSIAYNNYEYINKLFLSNSPFINDISINYNYMKNTSKFGNFFINNQSSLFVDQNNNFLIRIASNIRHSYHIKKTFGELTFNSILQSSLYSINNNNLNNNLNPSSTDRELYDYIATGISVSYEYPILIPQKDYAIKISPIVQLSFADYLIGNSNSSFVDSFSEKITHNNLFDINYYSGYDKFTITKNIKYGINIRTINKYRTTSDIFVGKLTNLSIPNENINNSNTYDKLVDYYYIYANIYPFQSTSLSYQGIISSKNFKLKENILTLGYTSPLLSLNSKYTQYLDLNKNLYNYSYMNELQSGFYIKINSHLEAGIQTTHLNNSNSPFSLRYLNYNISWIDNNLKVTLSLKRDLYANNPNNLNFNFQITIFDFNIKN